MKKTLLFTICNFAMIGFGFCQTGWEFQNPKPQGNDLRSLSFINRNNGWAVGVYGTILHTNDGGANWGIQNSGTTNHFYAVKALSSTTAIAAGEGGMIVRTTNSGTSWVQVASGTTNFLTSMYFRNTQTGFAVSAFGGDLLKTTNGGQSWTKTSTNITETVNEISFSSADTSVGFIVCGGFFSNTALYKTTNGGASWNTFAISTSYSLNSIYMSDTVAWIVGYDGVILRSNTNFNGWTTINAGNINTKSLYGVSFNGSIGVAGGEMGVAKRTTDGGNNWTSIMGDFVQWKTIRKVQMIDSSYGYLVGDKGKMMKTTNGGLNWTHMDMGSRTTFWSSWFTSANNGCAVGDSLTQNGGWADAKIYTTSDAGQNWSLKSTITNATLLGVHFPSTSTGYAVGSNGARAIYAKTTDGGANWTSDTVEHFGGKLWSVFFFSNQVGVAVGDSGMVMKTSDGGNTWVRKNSGTTKSLNYVYFSYNLPDAPPVDTGYVGFAAGVQGTLLKTNDLGESWSTVTTPATSSINGIHIVPRKAIWLAASSNKIYKSVSNGVFVQQTLPSMSVSPSWTSICAIDENNIYAVGSAGGIVSTVNGGTNWTQNKFTLNGLNAVHFENATAGWAVGEAGTIILSTTGGTTNLEESINSNPDIFLGQNYPNPFSLDSKIEFTVEKQSSLSLKVYDINGKEVKNIFNTLVAKGKYVVTINATDLVNGIYFYCLDEGTTHSVKKMIVAK